MADMSFRDRITRDYREYRKTKVVNRKKAILTQEEYDFGIRESTVESPRAAFDSSGGVRVNIGTLSADFDTKPEKNEKGEIVRTLKLPKGTRVGSVDFALFETRSFRPEMWPIAEAVLARDFTVALRQMEMHNMRPAHLVWATDKVMADFAVEHLGFEVTEKFPTSYWEKNERYQLVGDIGSVEAAVKTFSEREINGVPVQSVLMKKAMDLAVLPKTKIVGYPIVADTNFDIDAIIVDRATGHSFNRNVARVVAAAYGSVAIGVATLAAWEYMSGNNGAAGLDAAVASFLGLLAWSNRK